MLGLHLSTNFNFEEFSAEPISYSLRTDILTVCGSRKIPHTSSYIVGFIKKILWNILVGFNRKQYDFNM